MDGVSFRKQKFGEIRAILSAPVMRATLLDDPAITATLFGLICIPHQHKGLKVWRIARHKQKLATQFALLHYGRPVRWTRAIRATSAAMIVRMRGMGSPNGKLATASKEQRTTTA
jgi:hypothetical protein